MPLRSLRRSIPSLEIQLKSKERKYCIQQYNNQDMFLKAAFFLMFVKLSSEFYQCSRSIKFTKMIRNKFRNWYTLMKNIIRIVKNLIASYSWFIICFDKKSKQNLKLYVDFSLNVDFSFPRRQMI